MKSGIICIMILAAWQMSTLSVARCSISTRPGPGKNHNRVTTQALPGPGGNLVINQGQSPARPKYLPRPRPKTIHRPGIL